jgi:predicted RNA-binding Zn-ribbon protein involved in translation (DUF1610 family)
MEYILLKSFTNYIDAHIMFGRMEEAGINCWLKDENTVTLNPIITNAVGGIKLMVASNQAEEAQQLLKEFDLEKRASLKCPNCGSGDIEFISSPRKPGNWISSFFFFFLGNLALPAQKTWHCFSCHSEFEQPNEIGQHPE